MKTADAATLVNSAAFHPDYQITAHPFEGLILLEIRQRTYDSSRITSYGDYNSPVVVGPLSEIDPAGMDEDGVLFAVLGKLAVHHDHEARELLRVNRRGRWVAPFHPHTSAGQGNWDKRGGRAESNAAAA